MTHLRAAGAALRSAGATVRPLGRVVLVAVAVGFVASALLGWAEAATVAAAGAVLAVACAAFLVGRGALEVEIDLPVPRVPQPGVTAKGSLRVRNRSPHRLLALRVDLVVGDGTLPFAVPALAGGAVHEQDFEVPTSRRAVVPIGPARVVRADPVGLFRRVVSEAGAVLLYVHPATVPVPGFGAGLVHDLEGRESADRSPSDLAFHSLRPYVPGDPRRHIHWRTSARLPAGELMVQQFLDTRRPHVLLMLDDDASHYPNEDDFELAVSVLASVARRVVRDGHLRTVTAGSKLLGSPTENRLLDALSGVAPTDGPAGALRAAATGRRLAPGASIVVIVTGTGASTEELRTAARRFPAGIRVAALVAGSSATGMRVLRDQCFLPVTSLVDAPSLVHRMVRP